MRMRYGWLVAGVVVLSVRGGSTAARYGFQAGDIVQTINRAKVDNVAELDKLLRDPQRVWVLTVKRGDKVLQLQVPG